MCCSPLKARKEFECRSHEWRGYYRFFSSLLIKVLFIIIVNVYRAVLVCCVCAVGHMWKSEDHFSGVSSVLHQSHAPFHLGLSESAHQSGVSHTTNLLASQP